MPTDPAWIQIFVTIGSFLVFGTVYIVNGRNAAKILAARLETVDASIIDFKHEISKLTDVLVAQAVQGKRQDNAEERIMAQGKRIDEMEKRLNLYADSPIYRRTRGDI